MEKAELKNILAKYAGKHWVVALSGGADSRFLLEITGKYRSMAASICAVYVNHHLQDCATAWEQFCASECQKLGITFYAEQVEVSTQGSIEANAREERYKALAKHIDENSVLFTAHHADDLVETLLLAVLRGSGIDGLSAMPDERSFGRGILARPLLGVGRTEIEAWCLKDGLSYVSDPSNGDTLYDRNFLRHEIVPRLKERFSRLLPSACATVSNLGKSRLVYEWLLLEKLDTCIKIYWGQQGISLDLLEQLVAQYAESMVFKAELIRFFFKKYYGIILNSARLKDLESFCHLSSDNHASVLIDGFRICIYDRILFAVPNALDLKGIKVTLRLGETKKIGDYLFSLAEPTNCIELRASKYCRDWEFLVPQETKEVELEFSPGGARRLKPVKRSHSQILKMLWKEYRVPLFLRPLCPLITTKGKELGLYGVFPCLVVDNKLSASCRRLFVKIRWNPEEAIKKVI